MIQKIIVIHDNIEDDLFPLLSLLIGLRKQNPGVHIIWAGEKFFLPLIKHNRCIKKTMTTCKDFTVDILQLVFGADICVNVSFSKNAREFASKTSAKTIVGFDKNGPTSRESEFFEKIIRGKISTQKSSLQLFYDLAGLKWKGEGYGLGYYPKTKQTQKCGSYFIEPKKIENYCQKIRPAKSILEQLDSINRFEEIFTDDALTAYASIALRKKCTLFGDLSYRMEFFGNGKVVPFEGNDDLKENN